MALALLDLVDFDDDGAYRFALDIGTNAEFEIRAGPAVVERAGARFVDPVTFTTPTARSSSGGSPMGSAGELALRIPADREARYAQLFSWKAHRRAATFSDVVELPPVLPGRSPVPRSAPGPRRAAASRPAPARAQSTGFSPVSAGAALAPRLLSAQPLVRPASIGFDTILDAVLKLVQPVVADALKTAPGAGSTEPGSPSGVAAQLLRAVLGALPGAVPPVPSTATAQSLDAARFGRSFSRPDVARPFIFGIDDALIGAAIGQVVAILPQLANAANQKAKDRDAGNNAIVLAALNGINQRLMLDRMTQAQRDAQAAAAANQPTLDPEQLAALIALAGKLAPPATAPAPSAATPGAPTAAAKSLSLAASGPAPAARAVLEPLTAQPLAWFGGTDLLYARAGRIALRYRLTVGAPVPARPLARAILTVTLADERDPKRRVEKEVRLNDLRPGAEIECVFEPADLAPLPAGARLTATGALRWLGAAGRPVEALGSTKLVLVGPAFVAAAPTESGAEHEPVDLRRWRPFWNKIWEARAAGGAGKRWKLDVALRYAVTVDADERNAVVEPRLKPPAVAPDSAYELTTGRMKAGAVLGIPRLIELRALWNAGDALPADHLAALGDRAFLATLGGDFTDQVELTGRGSERGMVWAVPALRLFSVPLARVKGTNAQGAVTDVEPVTVTLPLPVGVRLIGLLSS